MELEEQVPPSESGGYRNRPVSWVRRGVRMTEGQQIALDSHGSKYLIEPPRGIARESIAPGWQLDLASIFATASVEVNETTRLSVEEAAIAAVSKPRGDATAPVVLEIGTGRGENIVAAAQREPNRNFVGVEVYGPGIARTILQAEMQGGFDNLKMIQADAPEVLASIADNSLEEIWIFFPDPWPKTKHFKRRMISAEFAQELARVLQPNGILRLATDWEHYAVQMQEVFNNSPHFTNVSKPSIQAEPSKAGASNAGQYERFEGRVLTAFENKAHRAGRQITDLTYRKTPNVIN